MSEHMEHYVNELNFLDKEFWSKLGYPTGNVPPSLPSDEDKFVKYRWQKTLKCIQCDRCLKWRELSWSSEMIKPDFPPPDWCCSNNWDVEGNE